VCIAVRERRGASRTVADALGSVILEHEDRVGVRRISSANS
jgi:hypothetical protein